MLASAEDLYLKKIRASEGSCVAYTFGEISIQLSRALSQSGVKVFREKFNCSKETARNILNLAYDKLGLTPEHGITQGMIEKEREELSLADFVFCPSPLVAQSLRDIGVAPAKLISASYGWEPLRFEGTSRRLDPIEGPTLLFVGFVCVRKGAHILLEAWRKAKIKGRLVLAGEIQPIIAERYKDVLAQSDVVKLPFTDDVGSLYRSADWFVFPSLEEGGPLVTYEAAGNGVAALISGMGAGSVIHNGNGGIVLGNDDPECWAQAIASLPKREEERRIFSRQAREIAQNYTWDKVGIARRDQVIAAAR
jgi:glycosyltransferase involved in cell wall biosynthesis